ncbi:MAG: trimethylamine methyltransferase family protein [Desulfosarcinaceae bacterium]|nr:trimethylamine methyltransferase family protein [Desulfosarcinaceae bacterium]
MLTDSAAKTNSRCQLQLLDAEQVEALKQAALSIMATVGFRVSHGGARRLLEKAGAAVSEEIVKIPAEVVGACLATAPKGWTIFNRHGQAAMEVRGGNSYFGTSTAAPSTMDAVTGQVRPTVLDDIRRGAALADTLENIDFVMPFGSAQDVPPAAADLYEFEAVLTHTIKPMAILGSSGRSLELIIEMASAASGGLRKLQRKPFLIAFPVHLSPLVFPANACERIMTAAGYGIPQVPSSAMQMGATSPITVAGSVALSLAEGLFCVVLSQLKKPGCPVALAANFTVMDMTTSLVSLAAPAVSLAYGLHAAVAQSYGLPTWGLAGATDAKAIDAQAGIEATFHLFAQALAGVNLIHDVGYTDSAMACSPMQLLMGNEIIAMVRQFINGATVNRETLATEVIEAAGPGGQFLIQRHTLNHLRETFWRPSLLDRRPRPQWEQSGAKTLAKVLREKLAAMSDRQTTDTLSAGALSEVDRIKRSGEKELRHRPLAGRKGTAL